MIACSDGGGLPIVELPFATTFAAPLGDAPLGDAPLGDAWYTRGGAFRTVDGELLSDGSYNVPLWLRASLPLDVTISFDVRPQHQDVDIKFEVFGDGVHHASGYIVVIGGWHNTKTIIARHDEHGHLRIAPENAENAENDQTPRAQEPVTHVGAARVGAIEPFRRHHVRFERQGQALRLFLDGGLYLTYTDPAPLGGPGNDRFAFNNWASLVYFDNLAISAGSAK